MIINKVLDVIKKNVSEKVLQNTSWLIIDKIVVSIISFIVYLLVAQKWGPEKLGLYNYAIATVSLFSTLAMLGIDTLILKDFIEKKGSENIILGTIFLVKLFGSFLIII